MSQTVDAKFEVDGNGHGMPVDLVPEAVTRREIRIARYDIYVQIMEEVFGSAELIVLADQFRPFSCREVWKGPAFNPFGLANSLAGTAFGGVLGGLAPFNLIPGVRNAQQATQQAANATSSAIAAAATSTAGQAATTVLGATTTVGSRTYEYQGCYFTDLGRQLEATSDRIVSVDATIVWLRRFKLS